MADVDEQSNAIEPEAQPARTAPASKTYVILGLTLTILTTLCTALVPSLAEMEVRLSDQWLELGRQAASDPRLIYLEIDKHSYAEELPDSLITTADTEDLPALLALQGDFPWNRGVFARLAEKLMEAGAKGVAFNFKFTAERDGDDYFKQVITNHSPGVIVGGLIELEAGLITLVQPSPTVVPVDEFGENLHSPAVGVLNMHTDSDDVVRHGLFRMDYLDLAQQALGPSMVKELGIESLTLHTLSTRVVQLLGEEAKLPPVAVRPRIRFAGKGGSFTIVSMGRVMNPDNWKAEFQDGEYFRDKVILVGPGNGIHENNHNTPNGVMTATEVHLNYINAVLSGDFIHPSGVTANALVTGLAGIIALILSGLVRTTMIRIIVGLLLSAALAGALVSLASQTGILVQSFLAPVLLHNLLMILRHWFNRPATLAIASSD